MLTFQHPTNGYQKHLVAPWGGALFLGPIYFALHGLWVHVVLGAALAYWTIGLSWIVYAFAAKSIIRNGYLSKGWTEVRPPDTSASPPHTAGLSSAQIREEVQHP